MYDLDMSAAHTRTAYTRLPDGPRTVDDRYLHQIIRTVSSTLDLDRVLAAIVDLVSEAIDCHATFIYFVEADGALTLRAVSDPYRALVGKLRFDPGEGLAGWVAEHDEPVFLADNALDDPRIKVVPEADEEKYQSFLAVPLRGKADGVLGVIALHAVAPREFSESDMDFLTHGASLVAGAIENARLYEDTRRRLALVEDMAALARTIAAAATLEELLPEVARRAHGLLEAEACQVFLVGSDGASLRLAGRWPPGAAAGAQLTAPGLAVELARHDGEPAGTRLASLVWPGHRDTVPLVTPLVSGEELLGFLAVRLGRLQAATPEKREVAALIAGQTAVAVQKAQLIDRLTERNAIKDFLEDLSRGSVHEPAIVDRGRALGCDLRQSHLVLLAAPRSDTGPGWDEVCANLESSASRLFPGSVFDRRDATVRGLVRVRPGRAHEAVDALRDLHATLNAKQRLGIGLSNTCDEPSSYPRGFEEAANALTAAALVSPEPGVICFDDLGAYKYLLRVSQDGRVRDARGEALRKLLEYDERHRTQLLLTLEEYLKRRGNIASAAQVLYVHPNTLRQRLGRIRDLTGLDMANEDWLLVEIELKLLRLETALAHRA
jgi:GAF domain-containing protein